MQIELSAPPAPTGRSLNLVISLNGWSPPWRVNNGVNGSLAPLEYEPSHRGKVKRRKTVDVDMVGRLTVAPSTLKGKTMATFKVLDMTCGRCASAITKAVANVDRAARIEVDLARKQVQITAAAATPEQLAAAIRLAGYTPQTLEGQAQPSPARSAGGCCCANRAAVAREAGQGGDPARGTCRM